MQAWIIIFAIIPTVMLNADGEKRAFNNKEDNKTKKDVNVPDGMRFEPSWRESGDCGPLSLFVLMRLLDRNVSVGDIRKELPIIDPEIGCSLAQMVRAGDALRFVSEVRFVKPQELPDLPFPFIIHATGSLQKKTGHFLVVVSYSPEKQMYSVIDTDQESYRSQTEESLTKQFSGYVLVPRDEFGQWAPTISFGLVFVGGLMGLVAMFFYRSNKHPIEKNKSIDTKTRA